MDLVERCPVSNVEAQGMDGLGEYRRHTAQQLIIHPLNTDDILGPASEYVDGYYASVEQANPDFGKYKAARTMRSIV